MKKENILIVPSATYIIYISIAFQLDKTKVYNDAIYPKGGNAKSSQMNNFLLTIKMNRVADGGGYISGV